MVRSLLDPPKRTPEAERRAGLLPPPEPLRGEWRDWCGLQALYLGEIIVGRVADTGGGRQGMMPRAIFNLAAVESGSFWFACKSVEEAKAEVERRLADWLQRTGLQ